MASLWGRGGLSFIYSSSTALSYKGSQDGGVGWSLRQLTLGGGREHPGQVASSSWGMLSELNIVNQNVPRI